MGIIQYEFSSILIRYCYVSLFDYSWLIPISLTRIGFETSQSPELSASDISGRCSGQSRQAEKPVREIALRDSKQICVFACQLARAEQHIVAC